MSPSRIANLTSGRRSRKQKPSARSANPDFQGLEAAEIGAVPLIDEIQRESLAREVKGEERALDSIGCDKRGEAGAEQEGCPWTRGPPPKLPIRLDHDGLERVGAGERQADDKAAMQIGP